MTRIKAEMESLLLDRVAQHLHIPLQSLDLGRSFTNHGGHSLTAVALSHACREIGVAVSVRDILTAPSIGVLVAQAEAKNDGDSHETSFEFPMSPDKAISAIQCDSISHEKGLSPLIRTHVAHLAGQYPATEMQMSLIRGTYENPKMNIIYHRQNCKAADLGVLRSAWETVVSSEDIFHADFHLHDGVGFWTRRCRPFSWSEAVVSSQADIEKELIKPPSFVGVGYTFKAIIARELSNNSNDACILFQVHHALIDGYSMERLLLKVAQVLSGSAPPPSTSMLDFLLQRDVYVTQHHDGAAPFWTDQNETLSKAVSDFTLPLADSSDYNTSDEESSFLSEVYSFQLGTLKDNIARFAQDHCVTEAAVYHGAWGLVMSLLTDSDCVSFGTAMSGRTMPIPGAMDVIGNLATTVPFAIEIDQTLSTVAFLDHVLSKLANLASVEWTLPDGCYARQFSSILALQLNQSMPDSRSRAAMGWISRMNTEVPISVIVEAHGVVNIQYSGSIYRHTDIEQMSVVYQRMLTCLLKPTHTISMCLLDAITPDQQRPLRSWGNCHSSLSTTASVQDSLVSLFRGTANRYSEAPAAQKAGQFMTYRELDWDSDLICRELSKIIAQPGHVVCVHADQSFSWLKAIYGVLKCGAVYCAINPSLSSTLQASTFQSSGASVYLVSSTTQKALAPPGCSHCLAIDEILSNEAVMSTPTPSLTEPKFIDPAAGAYLCFTSGSTGKPKGVLCTHQGLVAFQRDLEVRLFARPGWKIAQIMSVSFDGSIHEIFSALSYGSSLVLPTDGDPFTHLAEADAAIFTPSVGKVLKPDDYPKLKTVYLVGEQVPQDVCDRWSSEKTLYNMYGPTEATCGATIKRLLAREKVTIGKPNSSTRIYILDRHRRLTVPGWIGQVCLAGVQVSKGYIGQAEPTRQKFLPDPICQGLGESMYTTGDLGYWSESGEVVLVGRSDRQIKLRGFRLDLDDLETRIANLPEVSAAAVTRRDDDLVAMVQPKSISIPALRASMSAILPIHAIPHFCVAVDSFPLTKAGKLDYAKVRDGGLPRVATSASSLSEFERKVAQVWIDTLNLKDMSTLGPESSFSLLGGHSLQQLRLASRLSHYFSCHVSLGLVIENRNLHDQARAVSTLEKQVLAIEAAEPLTDVTPTQSLSPIERWWMQRYNEATSTSSFNVSFACELPACIDKHRLEQSWNTTLARHCILSSKYTTLALNGDFTRSWHHTRPKARRVESIDMFAEINQPFDIEHDELIRVLVADSHMLVVVSHILCDLTTMHLLLQDVACLYHGQPVSRPSPVYPVDKPGGKLESAESEEAFWTDYLDKSPESAGRALFTLSGSQRGYTGTSIVRKLPAATVDAMNAYLGHSDVTSHQLAVAAVALALQNNGPLIDITIGSPYMNRVSEADLDTVGLFLEPLPIRVRFCDTRGDKSSHAYVAAVQAASQAALSHTLSWERLHRLWEEKIASPDRAMFDVMVTFHEESTGLTLPIAGATTLYTWAQGAKFPLMCEFLAGANGAVVVRLEYDDMLLSEQDVVRIADSVTQALALLSTDQSMGGIRDALRSAAPALSHDPSTPTGETKTYFLQRLSEL